MNIEAFLTADYTTVAYSTKGTFSGNVYTTPKGKQFIVIGYYVRNGNGGYNYVAL